MDPGNEPARKKRRSRFDDDGSGTMAPTTSLEQQSIPSITGIDPSIVAAKAAEISQKILQTNVAPVQTPTISVNDKIIQENALRAAQFQANLASQIASVTNLLKNVKQTKDKKSQYRPLLLDSMGREIDEHGNVIRMESQQKTLALNNAVIQAKRKKENPYLAHRMPTQAAPSYVPGVSTSIIPTLSGTNLSSLSSGMTSVLPQGMISSTAALTSTSMNTSTSTSAVISTTISEKVEAVEVFDDRLMITNTRDKRGKRALHFVEPGKFIQKEEELKLKEERKIIAGYASGRKTLGMAGSEDAEELKESIEFEEQVESKPSQLDEDDISHIPPPCDENIVPSMEWWDEAFLPKNIRENRRRSRAAAENDDYNQVNVMNVKSYKYIQHPVSIKALGGDRTDIPLPMYLTKQERKRIRKTARAEREQEKRDKMMMGLIPPPEPKFKLSNFMKVLGDQAIADPSKVEMKVLQQMRQRIMNHEMRNQAAKLTPAEKKAKRMKKLQEDTSRQVHIAVFRVMNFENPKHRFKVDVNAQQHYLSGIVLLNQEISQYCNVIVMEGGPKGIKKMIRLMLNRIPWNDLNIEDRYSKSKEAIAAATATTKKSSLPLGLESLNTETNGSNNMDDYHIGNTDGHDGNNNMIDGNDNESDSDDDSDEDDEDEAHTTNQHGTSNPSEIQSTHTSSNILDAQYITGSMTQGENKCVLVWQGIVPKRAFTGFKFQECRNGSICRKTLESKNVAHYWDMATMNTSI